MYTFYFLEQIFACHNVMHKHCVITVVGDEYRNQITES